ncbi:membrane-spanning protein [Priestia endophytica]|uniref:membrane-spanning protein n=1 Tax=Priestia filamentosa TaxID=1402861 RepID=UPI003D28A7B9
MKKKLILILSIAFIIFMTALFIFYLIKGDSSRWEVSLGGIFASALPLLLLFSKNIPFPTLIIIGYYLFLFCTLFLGSIEEFYGRFKWWDATLHFYKGIYMGAIAISLYKLCVPKQTRDYVSKWILFLFVLSVSVNATAVWEIYEFVGDLTFTRTMQSGGNTDTMYDMIIGIVGGLLVAIYSIVRRKTL